MKYCCNLNFPVQFNPQQYNIPDPSNNHHVRIDKKLIDTRFREFLQSLGLLIYAAEYFYTAPNRTLAAHCDTLEITDVVKLNWMYGGEGSTMDWYEIKEGAELPQYETIIKTRFSIPRPEDITLVHRATIGKPSLVNVGVPHGVTNGPNPRHVHSIILCNTDNERVRWDDAVTVLKNFIIQ